MCMYVCMYVCVCVCVCVCMCVKKCVYMSCLSLSLSCSLSLCSPIKYVSPALCLDTSNCPRGTGLLPLANVTVFWTLLPSIVK